MEELVREAEKKKMTEQMPYASAEELAEAEQEPQMDISERVEESIASEKYNDHNPLQDLDDSNDPLQDSDDDLPLDKVAENINAGIFYLNFYYFIYLIESFLFGLGVDESTFVVGKCGKGA